MTDRAESRASGFRRLLPGGLLIGLAAAFLIANRTLPLLDGRRLGPGYLPLACGLVLLLMGCLVLLRDWRSTEPEDDPLPPLPWRGVMLVGGGLLIFAVSMRTLGMAPSAFLLVALSGLAAPDARPAGVLMSAAVLTLFVVGVFLWGLGLYIPALPPGLGF